MKYHYNVEFFRQKNENFYYLLGVLLTDGNIFISNRYNKIQLTSKDTNWLEILQELLRCPAYPTKNGHKNLTINSKKICQILIESGLLPNKSLVSKVPAIPKEYLPDFIRGCMDGDGSIPRGKNIQCYICSSSKQFLDDIQNILNEQNITSGLYDIDKEPYTLKNGKVITPKNKHYRLMIRGKAVITFLGWIYYPTHRVSMPRKNTIAQEIISGSVSF